MTDIIIANHHQESNILQNVVSGDVFEGFVQSKKASPNQPGLSDMGAFNLRTSTSDILNHCNPHNANENLETTHLVVGYVQSGKTMSFTGVLAMAKDNGYRVAVVLTGITTILKNQTASRLDHDLSLCSNENWFRIFVNPSKNDEGKLIKALRLSDRPLVVIPILKHRKYIDDIAKLFSKPKLKTELGNETVLIIDDEADQASLNSYGYANSKITDPEEERKESATYAAILRMRGQLSGNSYIQYTATPQANILITTMDLLSPKSHTLLEPGEDYIGGKKFFGLDSNNDLYNGGLIKTIPPEEVYHKKKNVLKTMPKSLRHAIIMHVWAVILVIKWYHRPRIRQLSMMVHPTELVNDNKTFESWIRALIDSWSETLIKSTMHEDRIILMEEFKSVLPEALQFYPKEGRPNFEDICEFIPDIINDSEIYRITGDSDTDSQDITWNAHRMNILVGAQMLNRGFTINNLATTYMPRYTTSVTNADTIEQRCRFFGYKKDYIESCRVYLPKQSIEDYKSYVMHEEELRLELASSDTLKEYERSLMLSPKLRPTRLNVLSKSFVKDRLVGWNKYEKITLGKMLHDNKKILDDFVHKYISYAHDLLIPHVYDSSKYKEGDITRHLILEMKTTDIISLLADYSTGSFSESLRNSMTVRYLQYLNYIKEETVDVVFMSGNIIRERTLKSKNDSSENYTYYVPLFQGRGDINKSDHYCGDTNIISKEHVTLQIHHVKVLGLPIANSHSAETYLLAIHFPKHLETVYCENVTKNFNITE